MTRISACDGRYLSKAQQRRAWEELNQIFGQKTPVPPGPDPGPDPPPPFISGNVVYYFADETVDELIIKDGIGDRVSYFIIPVHNGLTVPRPFICLSGKKEIVSLWTSVTGVEDPIEYMQVNFGFVQGDGEYMCTNRYELEWNEAWPKEFMMSETFYDDGAGHVYYQCHLDFNPSSGSQGPYEFLERFNYPAGGNVRPAVSFYPMNGMRKSGILMEFIGTISASFVATSPGPDPGPDPPDPGPDPPQTMVYDYGFEKSMTTWMGASLEPYVFRMEMMSGQERYGFTLPPNICLLCWSEPQVGFDQLSVLQLRRNGKVVEQTAFRVNITAHVPGVFECVSYDPHANRYFHFCSHVEAGLATYVYTRTLEEGDSVVFFPVAYADENQSAGWITTFCTWHPPL